MNRNTLGKSQLVNHRVAPIALVWLASIGCANTGKPTTEGSKEVRQLRRTTNNESASISDEEEPASNPSTATQDEKVATPSKPAIRPHETIRGQWVKFSRKGKFDVAACIVGAPRTDGGWPTALATTNDEDLADTLPCPIALPIVAPPPIKTLVLVAGGLEKDGTNQSQSLSTSFSLAVVVRPQPHRSLVELEDGGTRAVENARLIVLPPPFTPKAGETLLTIDSVEGVMRTHSTSTTPPRLRRLRGFDSGYFGKPFEIEKGLIRAVTNELDPGSLVALPLYMEIRTALVISRVDPLLVVVDPFGAISTIHRSAYHPIPVIPAIKPGDSVLAPFGLNLRRSKVERVDKETSHAHVKDDFFGLKEVGFGAILPTEKSLSRSPVLNDENLATIETLTTVKPRGSRQKK